MTLPPYKKKGDGVMSVRTQGQMGSADIPGKMDDKLKSENMQTKSSYLSS